MTQPVIEIRDLNFGYDGQLALENVNLRVEPGEFLAVLGPNGGGKTTLLKLMLGLMRPRSGSIRLFGRDPAEVLPRVGYVPQDAQAGESMPVSVLDVVRMGLPTRRFVWPGRREREDRQAVAEVLRQVEMEGSEGEPMAELSGGQRQRVLIARALAGWPELLILDEPTSSIDPQGKFCIIGMLSRLLGRMTIVAVSHDLSLAAAKLSSMACVNRRLIHNPRPELTQEMLALLYGEHGDACPMCNFTKDVSAYFQPGHLRPGLEEAAHDSKECR